MYHLTHSQKEIWNSQIFYPDVPLCNENICAHIEGTLDPFLFERCWDYVVTTNPALKTRIGIHLGEPVQFHDSAAPTLQIVDMSHATQPEISATNWMQSKSKEIIELSTGTVSSALLKLDEYHWIWFIQQHHIAVDAWSMTLIWNRLIDVYQNPAQLEKTELATKNTYNYLDFLQGYADRIEKVSDAESDQHWQSRQHADALALYGRSPDNAATNSTRISIELSDVFLERLDQLLANSPFKSFNRELGYYQFYLSVLISWLNLTTQNNKLTINMPNGGRFSNEEKNCIGYFIEILPFQIQLAEDSSFEAVYKEVQQESMRLIRHAKNGSCRHNDGTRPNVFYNYINGSFNDFAGFKTSFDWIYPGHTHPHHALRMHVINWDSGKNPNLALDFNDTWYSESQRVRAVEHLKRALNELCFKPQRSVFEVSLAGSNDVWAITDNTPVQHEIEANEQIQLAILSQCECSPDSVAVKQGSQAITYEELKNYSNQFAQYLINNGIGKGDRVVVHLERDWRILPVILGTLLIGAIYVPIDVANPSLRVKRIENNAKPSLVISEKTRFKQFLDQSKCKSIDDVFDCEDLNHSVISKLYSDIKTDPTAPAYLLYTSGSTGEPKGVEISHGSLWSYCAWAKNALYQGKPLSFPFVTSIGFDITNTSLLITCLTGGTLHVYPEHGRSDVVNVLESIKNTEINCLFFTPSQLSLITDQNLSHSKVTQIVSAGEQLKGSLVKSLQKIFDHKLKIYNGYGPTESTILSTFHQVEEGPIGDGPIPIGLPIAGMNCVVLDKARNPQMQGVPGELYLSGPLVSKGYWQNHTLTQDSFFELPHLFSGKIFYKTGDSVRVNSNGILEYLGRRDNQIKRNGIRLELGEIEAAALRHPRINSAVVVTTSNPVDTSRNPSLNSRNRDSSTETPFRVVLYYSSDTKLKSADLHQHLVRHLPCSAIPDQAIWLEYLPMNANGKTDISKLPVPHKKDFFSTETYVEPQTELQQNWLDIWQSVLNLDTISTNDEFFKIGGNSVLAIKLVAEINSLGYLYTPLDIFKQPTIVMLSKLERKAPDSQNKSTTPDNVPFAQISREELAKLKKLMG